MAAALTAKQKRWRVRMGIAPMNANERNRPTLAWLRADVGHFPVNGPRDEITVEAMEPYFAAACRMSHKFYALGADLACCKHEDDEWWDDGRDGEEGESSGEEGEEREEGEGDEEEVLSRKRVRKAPERFAS